MVFSRKTLHIESFEERLAKGNLHHSVLWLPKELPRCIFKLFSPRFNILGPRTAFSFMFSEKSVGGNRQEWQCLTFLETCSPDLVYWKKHELDPDGPSWKALWPLTHTTHTCCSSHNYFLAIPSIHHVFSVLYNVVFAMSSSRNGPAFSCHYKTPIHPLRPMHHLSEFFRGALPILSATHRPAFVILFYIEHVEIIDSCIYFLQCPRTH